MKLGQSLAFICRTPAILASRPEAFLLLRVPRGAGLSAGSPVHPPALLVSTAQSETLNLGPVKGGDEGYYLCLYQVTLPQTGLTNSTMSEPVHVTITTLLPVPTLSLHQQATEGHLTCTGSPAYPGTLFSLYRQGSARPEATQQVPLTHHRAVFPVPAAQLDAPATYQCQYQARLGSEWSPSERSLPVVVPANTEVFALDWPLLLGCLSAAVLFSAALAFMAVMVHRKVKDVAEEKRKREESMFWTKLQDKNYVVDLTLKRISYSSEDWANSDVTPETPSRSYPWPNLSSFKSPTHC